MATKEEDSATKPAAKEEDSTIEKPKLEDDDDEYSEKFWPADPPTAGEANYKKLQKFCHDEVEVIIHVVNENELRAAVRHMDPPFSPYERPVENFPEAPFIVGQFAKKKAALVQTEQGNRCRENIEKAIEVFKNAQCILLVGVGYAFDRKKYKLGDVLVSNSISDMMVWKFTKEGEVQDRGQTIDVEGFLKNIFCMNIKLKNPLVVSTGGRKSKAHCGQFVSFSALMDNESERDKFHRARDYAIGGEMEGGVVREVSRKQNNNIKGIIIIKGVVDYADGTKEKGWQYTTAMAAFDYTKSKLERANLPTKPSGIATKEEDSTTKPSGIATKEEDSTSRIVADAGVIFDSPTIENKGDISSPSKSDDVSTPSVSYLNSLPPSANPYLKQLLDYDNKGVDKDLTEIASQMLEWEEFATNLGLTDIEVSDIKHKYSHSLPLQRREALRKWKNNRSLQATYGHLLKLFEDGGQTKCAKAIFDILMRKISK